MKCVDVDVTFVEVPTEINLTFWISGCPRKCANCQTPWLSEDVGNALSPESFTELINTKGRYCTCVCFLGGEQFEEELIDLTMIAKLNGKKVALYTGADSVSPDIYTFFDYIKLGPYNETLGPLSSRITNQRFYDTSGDVPVDITNLFWEN